MFGIHPGDGQPGVNEHVIPQHHLREQIEAHRPGHPVHFGHAGDPVDFNETHGNGKTHSKSCLTDFNDFRKLRRLKARGKRGKG